MLDNCPTYLIPSPFSFSYLILLCNHKMLIWGQYNHIHCKRLGTYKNEFVAGLFAECYI